jgi:hypothetical protein
MDLQPKAAGSRLYKITDHWTLKSLMARQI